MSSRENCGLMNIHHSGPHPGGRPMAITMSLVSAQPPAPAAMGRTSAVPPVPTARSVPSLEAALRAIRGLGGTVTSETRTAPGIGSWAFVVEPDGAELVLWEDASATGL